VAEVKTYKATATREGKWWVVDVHGVGATQGRSTSEAEAMAADLVHAMVGVPLRDVSVEVDFRLPDEVRSEAEAVREAMDEAAQAQERAAAMSRKLVHRILKSGMSKRDAARALGLSPQRVSQLTK
jgi:hypothetical protein